MRMYWPAVFVASLIVASPASSSAQEQAGAPTVAMAEAAVGTGVADRQLTGTAESFPVSTGRLYCYSKITNAADTEVQHVWYQGETEKSRVTLKIGGSPWRTWSSKTLGEVAAGDWRCDVVQGETVVTSVKFKVVE